MRIWGFEPEDDNDNQYPQIYTMALSPTSPEPFHRQLREFFEPFRAHGFEPVHMSAYFDKFKFNGRHEYQNNTERILKLLADRSKFFDQNYHDMAERSDHDVVFVWDIADITMLTKNHIEELTLLRPDIQSDKLYDLRQRIFNSVKLNSLKTSKLRSSTRYVDNIEDAFIGDAVEMRKIAPMYDALRQLYNTVQSKNNSDSLICQHLLEKLGMAEHKAKLCQIAKEHQKVYNQRWKYAKRCMQLVNKRSAKSKNKKYANVVLCEEGVAIGASQLILAGFSSILPVENVYSQYCLPGGLGEYSYARMKSVIGRIQRRFGEKCLLIHVSSGPLYAGIPMATWPIDANEAFKTLYQFQRKILS